MSEDEIQKATSIIVDFSLEHHSEKLHKGFFCLCPCEWCSAHHPQPSGQFISVKELREKIKPDLENAERHVKLYADDLSPSGNASYQYWEGVFWAFNSILAKLPKSQEKEVI